MSRHNPASTVVLFPLCDKSGVLLDAVVFAWLLDLPTEIDSADAAAAVLRVIEDRAQALTPYQKNVVRELTKLLRRDTSDWTSITTQRKNRRQYTRRPKPGMRKFFADQSRPIKSEKVDKLVCLPGGRDSNNENKPRT